MPSGTDCELRRSWLLPMSAPPAYTAGMEAAEKRLFTPGTGAIPPTLAGREREQAVLSLCLADLTGGKSPPHDLVLLGPRGAGKTALLNWFERTCRESATKVDVAAIASADIPNRSALLAELAPPTGVAKLLPRKIGVAALASAEWAAAGRSQSLSRRLVARCRRRPLAVLLDEAHALDLEVGQLLLNASQQVRAKAPFLLVLAGTPGLPTHLGKMNASFWDRLGRGLLGIGRLSAAAAKEALVEPLAAHGVSIDADALDSAVEHSQRYAYFIQLWGEALWSRRLATGETRLTAAHAAAVRPAVAKRVAEYHQRRFRELEAGGLLPAAAALAPAFQAGMDATAGDQDIDAALSSVGLDASARLAAREELNRLGYIWCPPGQLPPIAWSAGIPSLMQHVLDQASPSPPGRNSGSNDAPTAQ